jgi:hypothetical protein
MTVGLTPSTAAEVNNSVGNILRQFTDIKESVNHLADSLAPLDLQAEPYLMSAEDETLIKSAVNGLDTALDDIDMTFVVRLTGMW